MPPDPPVAPDPPAPDGVAVDDASPADPGVDEPKPDGRRQRSERSRRAIVEALLALLREGEVRPSSTQVAARAGVTARTLFNHFGDMESLLSAGAAVQLEHVRELTPRLPAESDRDSRLASLGDQLALLFEDTMHVRWAVLATAPDSPASTAAIAVARRELRQSLGEFLAPELALLDEAAADRLFDALDPVCDPAVWRLRRIQQGLDPDRARQALVDTVQALVERAVATSCGGASTEGAPVVAPATAAP